MGYPKRNRLPTNPRVLFMKDHHDEYIYTRDHRTPAERRAAIREAVIGWVSLVSFTTAVFVLADLFLVG